MENLKITKNIEINNYKLDSFKKDLDELNILMTENQLCQFMKYYELLVEWNQIINLTAITDFDEVLKKHFIDSLSLIKVYSVNSRINSEISSELNSSVSLIDVGTGAGFPGIPLKIAFPNLHVTLLDSLQKRMFFLQKVIEELELYDVEAIHGRAEDFAKPGLMRESFDLCVSRAVANLSTLSEYCLPYVKIGGYFISYKADDAEVENAEHAITILGGNLKEQKSFTLPFSDINRNLIVIEKCRPTPKQYPRKAGTASKKPL